MHEIIREKKYDIMCGKNLLDLIFDFYGSILCYEHGTSYYTIWSSLMSYESVIRFKNVHCTLYLLFLCDSIMHIIVT